MEYYAGTFEALQARDDYDAIVRTLENDGFNWMEASKSECLDAANELLRKWAEEEEDAENDCENE